MKFGITFVGGADQFEPADKRGVAGPAASMLSEGTTTRDGDTLATPLRRLGTGVSAEVGDERGSIQFRSVIGKFTQTLDILADMLEHSTFPVAALERLRAQRLVILDQQKTQARAMADRVFPWILYGPSHPYGQYVTEESIERITRDDIAAFAGTYFKPGHAFVIVRQGRMDRVRLRLSALDRFSRGRRVTPSYFSGPFSFADCLSSERNAGTSRLASASLLESTGRTRGPLTS